MVVSGHIHGLAVLPLQERTPSTHLTGGWVASRACLEVFKNLMLLEGMKPIA